MANIIGTIFRDFLFGTSGDDTIEGLEGNDWLFGRAGNDFLDGGPGNDRIFTGSGFNIVEGGDGHDLIISHSDEAQISAGAGNDHVFHRGGFVDSILGDGNDRFFGTGDGSATFVVEGDAGNDKLVAHNAHALFRGGDGDDTLIGGALDDDLTDDTFGSPGENDPGNDLLIGGGGNDTLTLRGGNDVAIGGWGDDNFRFALHEGALPTDHDTIRDFKPGADSITFLVDGTSLFQSFDDLDTNGNSVLDRGDDDISVRWGSTVIDISAEFGSDPGSDTIKIKGETGLTESDFIFIG